MLCLFLSLVSRDAHAFGRLACLLKYSTSCPYNKYGTSCQELYQPRHLDAVFSAPLRFPACLRTLKASLV